MVPRANGAGSLVERNRSKDSVMELCWLSAKGLLQLKSRGTEPVDKCIMRLIYDANFHADESRRHKKVTSDYRQALNDRGDKKLRERCYANKAIRNKSRSFNVWIIAVQEEHFGAFTKIDGSGFVLETVFQLGRCYGRDKLLNWLAERPK